MPCEPKDPCYRFEGRLASMSIDMANKFVESREDSSSLSPQQLKARAWLEENTPPRLPPGFLPQFNKVYQAIRFTAIVMTTIESSGYFERTPEVQRYEESVLGSWQPGGMKL